MLSSENLKQGLLRVDGEQVQNAYAKEYTNNPKSLVISIPPDNFFKYIIFIFI